LFTKTFTKVAFSSTAGIWKWDIWILNTVKIWTNQCLVVQLHGKSVLLTKWPSGYNPYYPK
jgi:hypothetical protein